MAKSMQDEINEIKQYQMPEKAAQTNLWGTPQCTKGWERRCAQAISDECTCACGGHNHGTASLKRSAGEPIKIIKQRLFMKVEVYKKRMGYVASGTHGGNDYSFAGLSPMDAIEKAVNYIAERPVGEIRYPFKGEVKNITLEKKK